MFTAGNAPRAAARMLLGCQAPMPSRRCIASNSANKSPGNAVRDGYMSVRSCDGSIPAGPPGRPKSGAAPATQGPRLATLMPANLGAAARLSRLEVRADRAGRASPRNEKPRRSGVFLLLCNSRGELHIHVAHAAHAATGHRGRLVVLRQLGHHGVGGEDERRDGSGVLQRVARDLGRVQHAHRHHVAVLARLGVVAEVALALDHLGDDHARLVTRVAGDLAQRLLDRAQHDLDARGLVLVVGLDLGDRVLATQQRHATTGNDAFFHGGTGRVQRVFHAGLLLLHLDFGGRADLDHRDTAGELRHALLQLFLVVVGGRFLDLLADLLDAGLDAVFLAGAVDDRGVLLADFHALGAAEGGELRVLELEAQLLGDHGAAGEDRDVLEHGLAAVAEARGLDGRGLEDAAQVVHHQGRERLAVDVFRDDEQRTAGFRDLLQHRQQITDVRDLLVVQQDERVFEDGDLLFRVVDEVGRDVAAVELHALDEVELVLEALAVFHGDHAFLADLVHRVGDRLADLRVRVGGDGADLGDLLGRRARLADLLQLLDRGGDRLVDAALDVHRVHAGGDVLHALGDDRLREHGRGGGAVTGDVGGLGGDFLHQLRAHVLELVLELDLLRDRDTVLGDGGGAERALEHDVAALRAQRHLDRIGQDVHAVDHPRTRGFLEFDVFGCHGLSSRILWWPAISSRRP